MYIDKQTSELNEKFNEKNNFFILNIKKKSKKYIVINIDGSIQLKISLNRILVHFNIPV